MNKRHYFDIFLVGICGLFAIVAVWFSAAGGEPIAMWLLSLVLASVVLVSSSTLVGWRKFTKRKAIPALIAPALCLAIIFSVAATDWPLHASFRLAIPTLEDFARRLNNGETVSVPKRVGLLKIRRAEIYNGIPCLWINNDPGGNEGFAQCTREGMKFNIWSDLSMADHWQFVKED